MKRLFALVPLFFACDAERSDTSSTAQPSTLSGDRPIDDQELYRAGILLGSESASLVRTVAAVGEDLVRTDVDVTIGTYIAGYLGDVVRVHQTQTESPGDLGEPLPCPVSGSTASWNGSELCYNSEAGNSLLGWNQELVWGIAFDQDVATIDGVIYMASYDNSDEPSERRTHVSFDQLKVDHTRGCAQEGRMTINYEVLASEEGPPLSGRVTYTYSDCVTVAGGPQTLVITGT